MDKNKETEKEPFWSLGFLFNRSIAYISDASFIPEATWTLLEGGSGGGSASGAEQGAAVVVESRDTDMEPSRVLEGAVGSLLGRHEHQNQKNQDGPQSSLHLHVEERRPPPVLLIDCLRVYPHTSHFGCVKQTPRTIL